MSTEVSTVVIDEVKTEVKTEVNEVSVDPLVQQLTNMAQLLEILGKTSKTLTVELKTLTKDVNKLRLSKSKGKRTKRVVDPDAPRKLGALEKPVDITTELSEFLGFTPGEKMARQMVTQNINKYVKEHDLQNPDNRRYILLDTCDEGRKLGKLLRDPDQPLTFFNIQRYLKVHYPKADPDSPLPPPPSPTPVSVPASVPASAPAATTGGESEVPKKKVLRKVVKKDS